MDHRLHRFTRHRRRPAITRSQVRQHTGRLRDLYAGRFLDDLHDHFISEAAESMEEQL